MNFSVVILLHRCVAMNVQYTKHRFNNFTVLVKVTYLPSQLQHNF